MAAAVGVSEPTVAVSPGRSRTLFWRPGSPANVLPVGAALGAYGPPLLAFIPQVPFEWAALALGASAWLMQRREPLAVREGLALFAVIGGLLLCAAVLETVAVPHR